MKNELLLLSGILIVLILLYILVRHRQPFSAGHIVYSDLVSQKVPAKVLYSETHGLCGKPDLVCKKNGKFIPVEVKSMSAPAVPHPDNEMQLLAYCLLVEESTGVRPPYGILLYKDGSFTIRWDRSARRKLLKTLKAMRSGKVCCTSDRRKCPFCSYREVCPEFGEDEE